MDNSKNLEKENKILKVSINNEEEFLDIKIDDKRIILMDEEKDVIIIELEDKDNIYNYLEIDERYNLKNREDRFQNESL